MTTWQLRVLARLMFEWELLRAINWRDHNPVYRSISRALEARVDRALGFDGPPGFSPDDDLYAAILKSSRNRIIASHLHRAVVKAVGSPSYDGLTSKVREASNAEAMRLANRLGINSLVKRGDGFLSFLLLTGYYGARRAARSRSSWFRRLRQCGRTWTAPRAFWRGYESSKGKALPDTRPVMIVIRKDWPQVGYPVGKIVKELQKISVPVCCVLADGFDPTKSVSLPHGWEWLRTAEVISLPEFPYPLYESLTNLFLPQVPKRYRARGLRRFPSIPGLPVNFKSYSREFIFAANCACFFIESIQPRSVLNTAGDENLYAQGIAYSCLKSGIPIHSYYPLILYPTGMQPPRLTPSTLVVSKLDRPAHDPVRNGRSYLVVGSPLFDEAVPSNGESVGTGSGALRVIYLTKRVFPNLEVITQIRQALDHLGRKFHFILKPHPSDTESDYRNVLSLLGKDQATYVGAEEVESVERWIAQSDVVISGPSNAIWSALRQCKPVVYLNFADVGDHYYSEAYGRYAAASFVTARAVSEVGGALQQILRETNGGESPAVDQARFRALIEDVFGGGRRSARRIADLLVHSVEGSHT